MKSLYLKLFPIFLFFLGYTHLSAQTIPGIWYSNGKTVKAPLIVSEFVFDGEFTEPGWLAAGYNTTSKVFLTANKLNQKINITSDKNLDNMPVDYLYDADVSFGAYYDSENLYIGVVVKSIAYLNCSCENPSWTEGVNIYLDNDNRRSYHKDAFGNYDITKNYPTAFNEGEAVLNFSAGKSLPDGLLTECNQGITNFLSSAKLKVESAKFKPTADGYNLEIVVKLRDLFYNQANIVKKIGFDISYNITNVSGTVRDAQLMWNACCINRNWAESVHFGELEFSDSPNSLSGINFNKNVYSISGNNVEKLTATALPMGASNVLVYSILGSNPLTPIVKIDIDGNIVPINNGVATILGYAQTKNLLANANTITSAIVYVSGQIPVNSIQLNSGLIKGNYGSYQLTAQVLPINANQKLKWEIISYSSLVEFDTSSTIVSAKGIGNGIVKLRATSAIDGTKFAESEVTITGYYAIPASAITISAANFVVCGRSKDLITLTGVPDYDNYSFSSIFYNPVASIVEEIPDQLIKLNLITGLGTNYISKDGNSYRLNPSNGANFSIAGTYLFATQTITGFVAIKYLSTVSSGICMPNIPKSANISYFGYDAYRADLGALILNEYCENSPFDVYVGVNGNISNIKWSKDGNLIDSRDLNISGQYNFVSITMPGIASSTGVYQATVTGGGGVILSKKVLISMQTPVSVAGIQASLMLCPNQIPYNMNYTIAGGKVYAFQWEKNGILNKVCNPTIVSKIEVKNFNSDLGTYRLSITGLCNQYVSPVITVTAIPTSFSISGLNQSYSLCLGEKKIIVASVSGINNSSFEWNYAGFNTLGNMSSITLLGTTALPSLVLVTATGNCQSTQIQSSSLTLLATTTITSISQINKICIGKPYVLNAAASGENPITMKWTLNNSILGISNSITVSGLGNYSYSITGSCGSATLTTSISGFYMPISVTEPIKDISFCEGQTVQLKPAILGENLNYKWYKNAIELPTSNNYLGLNGTIFESGTYILKVYNDCEAKYDTANVVVSPLVTINGNISLPCSVKIDSTTGNNMSFNDFPIQIFPNPSIDRHITVISPEFASYQLISSQGYFVQSGLLNGHSTIELPAKGLYLLIITKDNKKATFKVASE